MLCSQKLCGTLLPHYRDHLGHDHISTRTKKPMQRIQSPRDESISRPHDPTLQLEPPPSVKTLSTLHLSLQPPSLSRPRQKKNTSPHRNTKGIRT